jgi:hypothetical protein
MIFTCDEVLEWMILFQIRFNGAGSIIYISKWVIEEGARICASYYEIQIATITLH